MSTAEYHMIHILFNNAFEAITSIIIRSILSMSLTVCAPALRTFVIYTPPVPHAAVPAFISLGTRRFSGLGHTHV